jgi:hypothetical protein
MECLNPRNIENTSTPMISAVFSLQQYVSHLLWYSEGPLAYPCMQIQFGEIVIMLVYVTAVNVGVLPCPIELYQEAIVMFLM